MDIQRVMSIINQIKEIPILNDENIKKGDFSILDKRSSVHYILHPLLGLLGYNVFNPNEVKVNDEGVNVYEKGESLIKFNLVEFDNLTVDLINERIDNRFKLNVFTTGIAYILYSGKEKLISFDIRNLEKTNVELVLKILLKDNLVESVGNSKYFEELLIESKFGDLVRTHYVREALVAELSNPSNGLIDLIVENIYDKYCEKMDVNILRRRLAEELEDRRGSLLASLGIDETGSKDKVDLSDKVDKAVLSDKDVSSEVLKDEGNDIPDKEVGSQVGSQVDYTDPYLSLGSFEKSDEGVVEADISSDNGLKEDDSEKTVSKDENLGYDVNEDVVKSDSVEDVVKSDSVEDIEVLGKSDDNKGPAFSDDDDLKELLQGF